MTGGYGIGRPSENHHLLEVQDLEQVLPVTGWFGGGGGGGQRSAYSVPQGIGGYGGGGPGGTESPSGDGRTGAPGFITSGGGGGGAGGNNTNRGYGGDGSQG